MADKLWCVIPAAGSGSRMASSIPKQYLTLNNQTVLEHTLSRVLQIPEPQPLLVVLSPNDQHWPNCQYAKHEWVEAVEGGETRAESVRNALSVIEQRAADTDWVLIHDAARPCVTLADITQLLDARERFNNGCLLGAPITDTVKQVSDSKEVLATLPREQLWRALTPQLFPYAQLKRAVAADAATGNYTDEAMAMERAGHTLGIVEGSGDNLKITHPEDLALASAIIRRQQAHQF